MRTLSKATLILASSAGLLLGVVGCQFLNFFPQPAKSVTASVETATPAKPGKNFYRLHPYVFLADFEINGKLPLFTELANLRDQVSHELQLPATQKLIQVYLFENRQKYEQYMVHRYPKLPKRRAFFVAWSKLGGTEDLEIYTYWGDRIQQDLRHELTHALLHSVLVDVPMWLDEGLAEYFENPPGWSGINFKHLDHLQSASGTFKPDMARLEKVKEVQEMNAADYRESWAWVHFMLRGPAKAKQVLMEYLQELRSNPKPGPLLSRLEAAIPDLDEALRQHLKVVDATRPTKTPVTD
jgi:hypothetical protein